MLASEDNDFLIKMGVSRKLLTEVMYKQKAVAAGDDKSTRRCLTTAGSREIQRRQRSMSCEEGAEMNWRIPLLQPCPQ